MSRDGVTGLVTLVASLVLIALTLDLKQNPMVPIGPGFYPRIVLGMVAALAAVLLAFDLFGRKAEAAKKVAAKNYGLVLAIFAIFGLYVGAMPFLGFRVSTLFFVAGLQATIEPPRGIRGWLLVAVTAFATTAGAYLLFETELNVLLPRGRWTGF